MTLLLRRVAFREADRTLKVDAFSTHEESLLCLAHVPSKYLPT